MSSRGMQDNAGRLSPELLVLLSARGDIRSFSRGQLLLQEGDASDALYILVTGQLKVFTRDNKGRELVYNVLDSGEFFGELLLDGGVRSASVKAIIDSQCIVVHENEIRQLLRTYPEFAECLIVKLISRVRHATQQVRSIALDGVYERIVIWLNEVVRRDGDTQRIPISITQQEIADRIGATREMVNHVLRDLVRGGYLAKDKEQLVILKELPRKW